MASPRIKRGRLVAALLRAGWRPPPLSDAAADRLIEDLGSVRTERKGWSPPPSLELSPTQTRCLQLLADGYTYAEIGEQVGISQETVKSYLKKTYLRLGARNGNNAVAIGFRRGLIW